MATDPTRITIAGRARIYLAPVGTVAPVDAAVALAAAWVEVGYTTEDGTHFTSDPTLDTVRSHQSNYPTRRFQTGDAQHVNADLQEWSADNFGAVFGGGTVTAGVAGNYRYTPPVQGGRKNVSAILEVVDGTKRYRFVVPVCTQDDGVDLGLAKTSEAKLPLRLGVIGSDLADPWYLLTTDPAFASMVALA